MKFTSLAIAAVASLVAATPALAVDSYLFGFSPTGSQVVNITGSGGPASIQAFSTGWVRETGFHSGGNTNYFTGGFGGSTDYRNFFQFDAAYAGTATSITLAVGNLFSGGLNLGGSDTAVTWTIYDLSSFIDTNTTFFSIPVWTDLGTGTVYGKATVTGPTSLVTVSLNAAGVAAFNAAAQGGTNGLFLIGGSLSGGAVPEPASWALMIAGFGMVGAAMRRRKAALAA